MSLCRHHSQPIPEVSEDLSFFHHVIHLSHTDTPTQRPPATAAARRWVTCPNRRGGFLPPGQLGLFKRNTVPINQPVFFMEMGILLDHFGLGLSGISCHAWQP